MDKKDLLNTHDVAELLGINDKIVYTLVSEKGLPATKITGKWLFQRSLIEKWLESKTINYPKPDRLSTYSGLLVILGSNDILLNKTIDLFNQLNPGHAAVFGNLGSLGGLTALKQNLCHIACSHLIEENEREYNFDFALKKLGTMPATVNFCKREQGLIIQKKNPKNISGIMDLARKDICIVNRPSGTGTRLLFDKQLQKSGINTDLLNGYRNEIIRHIDVGIEILSGRIDAGPGIRAVSELLNLDFISFGWERFDFVIPKERFFDREVQLFLSLLHEDSFRKMADSIEGYNIDMCGKTLFPNNETAAQ